VFAAGADVPVADLQQEAESHATFSRLNVAFCFVWPFFSELFS